MEKFEAHIRCTVLTDNSETFDVIVVDTFSTPAQKIIFECFDEQAAKDLLESMETNGINCVCLSEVEQAEH